MEAASRVWGRGGDLHVLGEIARNGTVAGGSSAGLRAWEVSDGAVQSSGEAARGARFGMPLTVAQGVGEALVVGTITAMDRAKSGVRPPESERLSQGG